MLRRNTVQCSCPVRHNRCVAYRCNFPGAAGHGPEEGSLSNTSTAAMPGRPRLSAAISASGSISSAREVLTSKAVGFMHDSVSSVMRPRVSSVRRKCKEMTSHCAKTRRWRQPGSRRSVPECVTLRAPYADIHSKRFTIARHNLANAAIAPDAQCFAAQIPPIPKLGGIPAALSPDCCHAPCLRLEILR